MQIIIKPRREGKTTELVKNVYKSILDGNNAIIVGTTEQHLNDLRKRYFKNKLFNKKNIKFVTCSDIENRFRGYSSKWIGFWDDIDYMHSVLWRKYDFYTCSSISDLPDGTEIIVLDKWHLISKIPKLQFINEYNGLFQHFVWIDNKGNIKYFRNPIKLIIDWFYKNEIMDGIKQFGKFRC